MAAFPRAGIAASTLLALLIGASAAPIQAQAGFAVAVNRVDETHYPEVTAYVTVSDANGLPITGLATDAFQVLDDSVPVTATVTAEQSSNDPLAIALALDLSGSMEGRPLSSTVTAITSLLGNLGPADEVSLITFADSVTLAVPPTTDKQAAVATLQTLQAQGDTALWDGVHEAINALSPRASGRRAVIVVTDGRDTQSLLGLQAVADAAVRNRLPVFPVGFGAVDQTALEQLAALTQGEAFVLPEPEELVVGLDAILARLREQYVLTFVSPGLSDGQEHQLLVRVKHRDAQAQAIAGYVPPVLDFSVTLDGLASGQRVGVGAPLRLAPLLPDRVAVSTVEYLLDSARLSLAVAAPFEHTWTPGEADLGPRQMLVRVSDAAGQVREAAVSFEVLPALTVTITAPGETEVVSGTVFLEADVLALSPLREVEFLVGGQSVGRVEAAPYRVEWNSAGVPAGDHELTVTARDVNGQAAQATSLLHVRVGINWGLLGAAAVLIVAVGLVVPLSVRARQRRLSAARPILPPAVIAAADPPPLVAWLVLHSGQGGEQQRWPLGAGPLHIGRQRSENQVVLASPDVSRRHAVITPAGDRYMLANLSQSLPLRVNGLPIHGQHLLADGDRIQISHFTLRFVSGPAADRRPESG